MYDHEVDTPTFTPDEKHGYVAYCKCGWSNRPLSLLPDSTWFPSVANAIDELMDHAWMEALDWANSAEAEL